jgi:hypothetical protein
MLHEMEEPPITNEDDITLKGDLNSFIFGT